MRTPAQHRADEKGPGLEIDASVESDVGGRLEKAHGEGLR
jgi:hypothetical protein